MGHLEKRKIPLENLADNLPRFRRCTPNGPNLAPNRSCQYRNIPDWRYRPSSNPNSNTRGNTTANPYVFGSKFSSSRSHSQLKLEICADEQPPATAPAPRLRPLEAEPWGGADVWAARGKSSFKAVLSASKGFAWSSQKQLSRIAVESSCRPKLLMLRQWPSLPKMR
jgi:hypothetical protein